MVWDMFALCLHPALGHVAEGSRIYSPLLRGGTH